MDNESLGEEEAAFFDVQRTQIDERRQIHLLQLLSVSSATRNRQRLDRVWVIIESCERERRLVVTPRSSLSERHRQSICILRHQLSYVAKWRPANERFEIGNI